MNRQRFLAELSQLLSFMAEQDRAEFLKDISARFDAAGPEGEQVLISQLGTPTALAVRVSRGYRPSDLLPEESGAASAEETEPEEVEAAPAAEPEAQEAIVGAEPEAGAQAGSEPAEAVQEFVFDAAPEEEEPTQMPPTPDLSQLFGISAPAAEAQPTQEKPKRPRGRGALVALTISGGLLLAVLILALAAIVLAPGAAGLCTAALFGLAGLWASSVITDALFLFGIALIALAVGLLLLFLAVWLLVCIIKPLVSGIVYLFRLTGGEGE